MKFVDYEKLDYKVTDSLFHISRSKRILMKQKYDSAIIKDLSNIKIELSAQTQKLLEDSSYELAKLDGYIKDKIKGFPIILLRTEALSSTQIEHYSASNRNIAKAQILKSNNKESNLIKDTLETLIDTLYNDELKITLDNLVRLNKQVLNDDSINIRNKVNWIGKQGSLPQEALYVPPHPRLIEKNLNEFIEFCKRDDINPLVQSALAHAYFEIIHPFDDGNGRVGRIIMMMILKEKLYLENMFLPISSGLVKNTTSYIEALNDFKDGNYESIINLVLENTISLIPQIYETLFKITNIKESWKQRLTARQDAFAWTILDELIIQPVISVNYLKNKYKVNDQAIRNNIETLIKCNVISKVGSGSRNVVYEAKEILEVLDKFNI